QGAGGSGELATQGAGGSGELAAQGAGGSGELAARPLPWRLHIYLTDACNLRCRHCGVTDEGTGPAQLDAALVCDLIDQAVAAGAEGVVFSGGEPLLHPDFATLVAYAAPRLKTLVATNAVRLNDAIAETLVQSGAIVQVSLDGPDAATHDFIRGAGAFERTWQGIERLQRAGIGARLALNVTLMRTNIGRVAEIVALAGRRGIAGVRFGALQRMGRAAGRWAELAPTPAQYAAAYRALYRHGPLTGTAIHPGLPGLEPEPPDRGLWCGLGRTLLVDARGDLYPCGLFLGPQFRLGNVHRTPLGTALTSPLLERLIGRCTQRREAIAECRSCVWKHFCQGGCAGSVWLLRETLDATDGLGAIRRELFPELLMGVVQRQELVD
ncbi:MAG: radical SAM protein, partial [Anaerolineae bacterium]|nr:radical SAM protein [Anaerolineae bacterium]